MKAKYKKAAGTANSLYSGKISRRLSGNTPFASGKFFTGLFRNCSVLFFTVAALSYFNFKYNDLKLASVDLFAENINISENINEDKDVYLLASLINCEAQGENYTGQVAVGAVILNRIKDPSFPDTVSGVIYQPGAFASVTDNRISAAPDKSSINAARDALSGWDPTNGSLYYWNPQTAASKTALSIPVTKVIGRHAFGTI